MSYYRAKSSSRKKQWCVSNFTPDGVRFRKFFTSEKEAKKFDTQFEATKLFESAGLNQQFSQQAHNWRGMKFKELAGKYKNYLFFRS